MLNESTSTTMRYCVHVISEAFFLQLLLLSCIHNCTVHIYDKLFHKFHFCLHVVNKSNIYSVYNYVLYGHFQIGDGLLIFDKMDYLCNKEQNLWLVGNFQILDSVGK